MLIHKNFRSLVSDLLQGVRALTLSISEKSSLETSWTCFPKPCFTSIKELDPDPRCLWELVHLRSFVIARRKMEQVWDQISLLVKKVVKRWGRLFEGCKEGHKRPTYDAMIANSSSPGLCKTMNLVYNLMNTDMEASAKKILVTIITASPEGLEPAMMYELSIQ